MSVMVNKEVLLELVDKVDTRDGWYKDEQLPLIVDTIPDLSVDDLIEYADEAHEFFGALINEEFKKNKVSERFKHLLTVASAYNDVVYQVINKKHRNG